MELRQLRRAIRVLRDGYRACEVEEKRSRRSARWRGEVAQVQSSRPKLANRWSEDAERIRKACRRWTEGKGIQGYGIGYALRGGKQTKQRCLKIFVEKKLPKRLCDNFIPSKLSIPGIKRRIPIDVEAIGRMRFHGNVGPVDPVRPGFSISNTHKKEAGTYGCLVQKGSSIFVLSNRHVMFDTLNGAVDDAIVHPGRLDDPDGEAIAKLHQWVKFHRDGTGEENLIDAAIAKAKKSDVSALIDEIGIPKGSSDSIVIGNSVELVGRTSRKITGKIKSVDHVTKRVTVPGVGRVRFHDTVLCDYSAKGGDSGSAILNKSRKVLGLHFMGSTAGSVFCRWKYIEDAFDVSVVTS